MAADPSTLDIVEAGHQLRAKTLTAEALTIDARLDPPLLVRLRNGHVLTI